MIFNYFLCLGPLVLMLLCLLMAFVTLGSIRPKYSLLNSFPYEAGEAKRRGGLIKGGLFGATLFALSCFAIPLFLQNQAEFQYLFPWAILTFALLVFAAICLIALLFLDPSKGKPHFYAFFLGTLFLVVGCLQVCFLLVRLDAAFPEYKALFYILAALIALPLLTLIIFLLSPRMANWAKLDTTMEEDGSIVAKRPKFFPFAFLEWMLFLCLCFAALVLSIAFLVVLLA